MALVSYKYYIMALVSSLQINIGLESRGQMAQYSYNIVGGC